MSTITHYQDLTDYITRDGSTIREIMHPSQHGNKHQSLAEAVVQKGQTTLLHKHMQSEELYYITQGAGLLRLDQEHIEVTEGDCICIHPGTAHQNHRSGRNPRCGWAV